MRYILEIYAPGSARDVAQSFESEQPFATISRGDIINAASIDFEHAKPGDAVIVSNVEHFIWKSPGTGNMNHKLMVYTHETFGDQEGLRKSHS